MHVMTAEEWNICSAEGPTQPPTVPGALCNTWTAAYRPAVAPIRLTPERHHRQIGCGMDVETRQETRAKNLQLGKRNRIQERR